MIYDSFVTLPSQLRNQLRADVSTSTSYTPRRAATCTVEKPPLLLKPNPKTCLQYAARGKERGAPMRQSPRSSAIRWVSICPLIILLSAGILFGTGNPAFGEELSDAAKMTALHAPGSGEQERVQRRFEFLLGAFEKVCTNEKGAATIPDRLVFIHQKLKEAGLDGEESLLDLSNTLHRLTHDIAARASAAGMDPPQCSEIWVMYLTTRQKGQSSSEASRTVTAATGALYNLVR